ncbi:MAG: hypothetical protein H0X29_00940 [Parachlamydiaceae bacterium]|nr:hypothetical protein [Parachlamydiaceae bacterium]
MFCCFTKSNPNPEAVSSLSSDLNCNQINIHSQGSVPLNETDKKIILVEPHATLSWSSSEVDFKATLPLIAIAESKELTLEEQFDFLYNAFHGLDRNQFDPLVSQHISIDKFSKLIAFCEAHPEFKSRLHFPDCSIS